MAPGTQDAPKSFSTGIPMMEGRGSVQAKGEGCPIDWP